MSAPLAPKLRFPGFDGGWHAADLGDAIEEIAMGPFGSNLKVEMFTAKGVPIIKGGNLLKPYVTGPYSFVSEEKATSLGRSIAYPGDFIVTHRGTLGQVSLVTNKDGFVRYVTSQSQLRFRTNKKKLRNDWLIQYLRSTQGNRRLLVDAGQVGVPAISFPTTSIKSVLVVAPHLNEQAKIADFLTAVDERTAITEKNLMLLKKYKKGVMQKIFTKKLRFKDENGNPYLDWKESSFDDAFMSLPTKQYQIQNSEYNKKGTLPVVDQGQDYIAGYTNQGSRAFTDVPVIIFGDHTTFLKFIDFDFVIGADGTKAFRSRGNADIKYLYYFLEQNKPRPEGYKRHTSALKLLKVDLPCEAEQQKVATFLTVIDDKINAEEANLIATKRFKKSLLQRMFV